MFQLEGLQHHGRSFLFLVLRLLQLALQMGDLLFIVAVVTLQLLIRGLSALLPVPDSLGVRSGLALAHDGLLRVVPLPLLALLGHVDRVRLSSLLGLVLLGGLQAVLLRRHFFNE